MSPIQRAIQKAGGPSKVANLIGVSLQAACFYRDGKRTFPVEHGAALEAASGVRRWEMWPQDWHRIWPELIGAEGAPEISSGDPAPAPSCRLQKGAVDGTLCLRTALPMSRQSDGTLQCAMCAKQGEAQRDSKAEAKAA